jgi:hypothetical protein
MIEITINIPGLDKLTAAIETMAANKPAANEPTTKEEPKKTRKLAEKKAPVEEPELEEEPLLEEDDEPAPPLDYKKDVMPIIAKLIDANKSGEVRKLLNTIFKVNKGSEVPTDRLAELKEKLEEI